MREHDARPWRFGATDYAEAVRAGSSLKQPLPGRAIDAAWDKALSVVMQQYRVVVAEEALAASLLPDLGDP